MIFIMVRVNRNYCLRCIHSKDDFCLVIYLSYSVNVTLASLAKHLSNMIAG